MSKQEQLLERREGGRFQVEDGAFVLLGPRSSLLGQIIEISLGGLSFLYTTSTNPAKDSTELDILLADHSFYFDKIPCNIVSDLEIRHELSMGSKTIRRCSVEFGDLSKDQKSQLEYFIRNHTAGEISAK